MAELARDLQAGAAASVPGKPLGPDEIQAAAGSRSTPASSLPRIPLRSCPSLPPGHSSAVTRPKNSQMKNDPKPQTSPNVPFGARAPPPFPQEPRARHSSSRVWLSWGGGSQSPRRPQPCPAAQIAACNVRAQQRPGRGRVRWL